MQDLLVEYLEGLESCLSLKEYNRLISKAESILPVSMFEKLKQCFEYQSGWLFVGLDFDSLEDKISAVTTRDPGKIKVYTDGYDGHCLRAFAYFGEHMPDIQNCPATATPYKVAVGDDTYFFHSEEKIEYLGQEYLGSELFKLLNK